MRRRTIATSALFVCAATALTACSGGGAGAAPSSVKESATARSTASASPAGAPKAPYADLTGGQIFTDALKATRQATSLHLNANINDPKGGSTKLDLTLDTKGDCTGTVGEGKDDIGMIKTGKIVYLRPSGQGGKWTKSNTTSADAKDLASICDLKNFIGGFPDEDTEARKGATTKVDGVPAIVLTEKDGAESYTMDVATSGKPYLLKMVTVGGDNPGTLTFSRFGEPVHAVAPPKSSIAAG
ncbi:hypothetical protein ACFXOD_18620 [Streptomyces sp. NPDC059161]|uniref:hypothetical protein n=1 Tax=Streptomyces sp. NPDC059161 TaxID=3346749 RepID=UPI0036A3E9A4